ncbi:uncharacterized protein Hap1MRO34_002983 isoform 2-T2 [Clarias gariepinus]
MAGGPPLRNQNSRVNMDNTGGGVQMSPIVMGNDIQGQFTCRNNYTGPPPREGAAPVVPRPQNDGTINLRNEGSLSNQPILKDNTFGGNVDVEQNINIQVNNEGRNEDVDLR